ncbi:hypothetical protein OIU84_001554 [Salix udensis]|uniref:Uncharacterized protein n=1 Tax=Salix udensis TaxID=889485 RepID=A0AAD6K8N9_9ROSI|nr:hypothetical protein OIU84_001554 [Salix udensis]
MHQADLPATSKENRSVGERSASHWQPRSQPYSAINQRGSRTNGGQNTGSEVGRGNKKDSTSQTCMPLLPQPGKDIATFKAQPHPDRSLSEKSHLEEAPHTAHQEETKTAVLAESMILMASGVALGKITSNTMYLQTVKGRDLNSHYEYQPVGPQNIYKDNNFESSKDGSHYSVARSRERGQGRPRHGGGNPHVRQTGSARVDANYD